jgi:hypothetical protein
MARKSHNVNEPKTGAAITTVVSGIGERTEYTLSVGDSVNREFRPVPAESEDLYMTFAGRVDSGAGWMLDVFVRTKFNGETVHETRTALGTFMKTNPTDVEKIVTVW